VRSTEDIRIIGPIFQRIGARTAISRSDQSPRRLPLRRWPKTRASSCIAGTGSWELYASPVKRGSSRHLSCKRPVVRPGNAGLVTGFARPGPRPASNAALASSRVGPTRSILTIWPSSPSTSDGATRTGTDGIADASGPGSNGIQPGGSKRCSHDEVLGERGDARAATGSPASEPAVLPKFMCARMRSWRNHRS
jgi:hypothetical protein